MCRPASCARSALQGVLLTGLTHTHTSPAGSTSHTSARCNKSCQELAMRSWRYCQAHTFCCMIAVYMYVHTPLFYMHKKSHTNLPQLGLTWMDMISAKQQPSAYHQPLQTKPVHAPKLPQQSRRLQAWHWGVRSLLDRCWLKPPAKDDVGLEGPKNIALRLLSKCKPCT